MDPKRLAYILDQYHHNRCTPKELEEFEQWYADLDDVSLELPYKEGTPEGDAYVRRQYKYFSARLKRRRRNYVLKRALRVAAVSVLLAGAGWLAYSGLKKPSKQPVALADIQPGGDHATLTLANGRTILLDNVAFGAIAQEGGLQAIKTDSGEITYQGHATGNGLYNTLATPKGGRYMLRLPDGTKVWLNAATSLKFPVGFSPVERRVVLKGEAYFEVARDASRPFYVNTADQEVKVLGTHFIVSSYPDEKEARTTLLEGSVKVTAYGKERTIKPGQVASLRHNDLVTEGADLDQAIAWKDGVIDMTGQPLDQILREISRWYDIEVIYESKIPDIKLNGQIDRGAMLSQVLAWLDQMGVKSKLEGRRLTIRP